MKGKKIIVIVAATLAIAVGAVLTGYGHSSKPDYVKDAISRLGSNLSSYYGPTECSGKIIHDKQWQVICIISSKGKSFEFAVMNPDQAPYSVARSFYLKATNANAKEAAHVGLMKYLEIDTVSSLQ